MARRSASPKRRAKRQQVCRLLTSLATQAHFACRDWTRAWASAFIVASNTIALRRSRRHARRPAARPAAR